MLFRAAFLSAVVVCGALCQPMPPQGGSQPIYRVTVVQRTTPAINYGHRNAPTKIDFRGTPLIPLAHGDATIEDKRGAVTIDAKFNGVPAPSRFGTNYLTYVLWAISPEGRAHNLGELVLNGSDKGRVIASTQLQAFALIVTAEPYFSVSQPSDVVVMENAIRPDTVGSVEQVNATYELLPRGEYTYTLNGPPVSPVGGPPLSMGEYEAVLATYQAQNAIQIAQASGADRYAPEQLAHARELLNRARGMSPKSLSSDVVATAREAAQIAEDARALAMRRSQQEQAAVEQQQVSNERAQASQARRDAEVAREQADMAREQARATTEEARAQAAAAQAQADRAALAAEQARATVNAQIARPAPPPPVVASADRMANTNAPSSEEELARANRVRLMRYLSSAFPTLDTPRGLVMTIPDSLLTTQAGIQAVRNRLAPVMRDFAVMPRLEVTVEGHSDAGSTGAVRMNSSEALAASVRNVLVGLGISADKITIRGFGDTRPLGPSREANRRVEVVFSSEDIGKNASWDRGYPLSR